MRADLLAYLSELGISLAEIQERGLPECEEAAELERVEIGDDGKEHLLVPAAAQAWRALKAAAIAENIQLFIVSAFRSIERQAELVRRKLAAERTIDEILSVCAPPGFSEHHTGRAVDISTPGVSVLEPEFDQTAAFAWLTQRAKDFGFHFLFPPATRRGTSMNHGTGASTTPNPSLQVLSALRDPAVPELERWAPHQYGFPRNTWSITNEQVCI